MKYIFFSLSLLLTQASVAQWTSQSGTGNYYLNSGYAGIGTSTPLQQMNIYQVPGMAKGILLSGDEYFVSGNSSTNGVLLLLGVNRTQNRQLWIGDNTVLGSPTLGFVRMITGGGFPGIDCVSGDGNHFLPLFLGDNVANVGVGYGASINTPLPASELTINGNLAVGNGYLGTAAPTNGAIIQGAVLIGKSSATNSSYLLDINGNVRANTITVNTTGADFVFSDGYKLPTLAELAAYVAANHHLPGITSAENMQKNGIDLGENQTRLLQKIEELTLYLIDKDKQLETERETNAQQQEQISLLEERLEKLEKMMTGSQVKVATD